MLTRVFLTTMHQGATYTQSRFRPNCAAKDPAQIIHSVTIPFPGVRCAIDTGMLHRLPEIRSGRINVTADLKDSLVKLVVCGCIRTLPVDAQFPLLPTYHTYYCAIAQRTPIGKGTCLPQQVKPALIPPVPINQYNKGLIYFEQ